jgi:hypothetical protein
VENGIRVAEHHIEKDVFCNGKACLETHLYPRAEREKCNAPKYTGPQHRRSEVSTSITNNVTIVRRVMGLPAPGLMEAFMMHETDEDGDAVPVVWDLEEPDPTTPSQRNYYDTNTALFQDFRQPRSLAAARLKGCTMLAIIGRRGVYMGHYWESISFDPDDEDLEQNTAEEIFEDTVIKGLKTGISGPVKPSQMSLTRFAQQLGDEHVKAYLIRPRQNSQHNADGRDGYPEQWQRMKDEIVRILPKVGEPGRWENVIYDVQQNMAILKTTSQGRVLSKVDPQHVKAARRREKDTRLAILWVEQREVHRDEWQDA